MFVLWCPFIKWDNPPLLYLSWRTYLFMFIIHGISWCLARHKHDDRYAPSHLSSTSGRRATISDLVVDTRLSSNFFFFFAPHALLASWTWVRSLIDTYNPFFIHLFSDFPLFWLSFYFILFFQLFLISSILNIFSTTFYSIGPKCPSRFDRWLWLFSSFDYYFIFFLSSVHILKILLFNQIMKSNH